MARKPLLPPLEGKIQKSILEYLRSVPRCWAVKILSANERGVPDIVCCCRGRFYGFEVKAQGGKATAIQDYQGEAIGYAGGVYRVVRSKDEVRAVLGEVV